MEPGTVHRETDKPSLAVYFSSHCRTAIAVLLLISAVSVCLLSGTAAFAAGERDGLLEESGIRYPDGFDEQTVGEMQGTASSLFRPRKGPVSFELLTESEKYVVIASPPWYWNDLKVGLSEGEEVTVIGSKSLGNDGRLYIIAREIRLSSGRSFVLRGKDGTALWKGGFTSGSGNGSGWGSTAKGRGGMGGGYGGGAGRGRR